MMLALAVTTLLAAQLGPPAEAYVAPQRFPAFGATDVPRNSVLLLPLFEKPGRASLVTVDDESVEQLLSLAIDEVDGLVIVRVPEQPENSDVLVRLENDFDEDGTFESSEEHTWRTGAELLDEASLTPELISSSAEAPLFRTPYVSIELERDAERAALLVYSKEEAGGTVRTFETTKIEFGLESIAIPIAGAAPHIFEVVSVDAAGNESEPLEVVVQDGGGCSATSQSAPLFGAFAFVLLIVGARRRAMVER